MKQLIEALLKARFGKLLAGGLGAVLAAIGGLTTMEALQPDVEKAADLAARGVVLYCELPRMDRDRFRSEVLERLSDAKVPAAVRVVCPQDVE